MPLNCPSCQERNPSNAARCMHCGASLQTEDDEQVSSSSKNMMLGLVILVAGMVGALMYVSDGSPGDLITQNSRAVHVCVQDTNSADIRELKKRDYKRCKTLRDKRRCRKQRRRGRCYTKELAEGEKPYRPAPKAVRKMRNIRDLVKDRDEAQE